MAPSPPPMSSRPSQTKLYNKNNNEASQGEEEEWKERRKE